MKTTDIETRQMERPATHRVWIDESTCIGSGSCARLARGAFIMDESQGVAVVGTLDAVDSSRLLLAERSCPTGAIHVEKVETDQIPEPVQ